MDKRGILILLAIFLLVLVLRTVSAQTGCCVDPGPALSDVTTQADCTGPGVNWVLGSDCTDRTEVTEVGCCVYDDRCEAVDERIDCQLPGIFNNTGAPTCQGVQDCNLGCCALIRGQETPQCRWVTKGSCDVGGTAVGLPAGFQKLEFTLEAIDMNEAVCSRHCEDIGPVEMIEGEGIVTNEQGQEVQGVRITIQQNLVTTDSQGYYKIENILPGTIIIKAEHTDYVTQTKTITSQLNFQEDIVLTTEEPPVVDVCPTPIDCSEAACEGKNCSTTNPYWTCQAGTCQADTSFCEAQGGECGLVCFQNNIIQGYKSSCPGTQQCCDQVLRCTGNVCKDLTQNIYCNPATNIERAYNLETSVSDRAIYCEACPQDKDCLSCISDGFCDAINCGDLDPDCIVYTGTLTGKVTDEDTRNPIEGASIIVSTTGTGLTDIQGIYNIQGLPVGTAVVRAKAAGYASKTLTEDIDDGSILDVQLKQAPVSCTAQIKPSPQDFRAVPVRGKPQLRLLWDKPCPQITGFMLSRFGTVIATLDADATSYIDTGIVWENDYFYELLAIYDNGAQVSMKVNTTGNPGDDLCEDRLGPFCLAYDGTDYSTLGDLNARVECDADNQVELVENCQISDKVCAQIGARTECKIDPGCEKTGMPLGLFYTKSSCLAGGDNFCYYDYSDTSIDACYSCGHEMSCLTYRSQDACEEDSCGAGPCEWNELEGMEEFNSGVCTPVIGNNCEACSSEARVFNNIGCTQELCSLLGECFSTKRGCSDCENVVCEDFQTEQDCTGGIEVTDNTCNDFQRTNDRCELGVCRWTGDKCIKDGNGDGLRDSGNHEDVRVPETIITSLPSTINTDGGTVSFAVDSDVTELRWGLNDGCPDNVMRHDGLGIVQLEFDVQDLDQGINTLYYYSVDANQNREQTKSRTLYADTSAPTLDITYIVQDHQQETLSTVTITVVTDGISMCNDSLNNESKLTRVDELTWQAIYTLEDGSWKYEVECIDTANNKAKETIHVNVARDLFINITNPGVFTNQKPTSFEATTEDPAFCYWKPSNVDQLFVRFAQTGERSHATTIGQLSEGTHTYTIACQDLVNKQHRKNIQFTTDYVAPSTTIIVRDPVTGYKEEHTGATFSTGYFSQAILTTRCNDTSSGCSKTFYCQGIQCEPTMNFTRLDLAQATQICVASTDNAGNKEQKRCGTINIDSNPPELNVISPTDNSIVGNDVVNITGTFASTSGVRRVISQSAGFITTGTTQGNSFLIEEAPLEQGNNSVIITVWAGNGLTASRTLNIISDTEGPGYKLDNPIPEAANEVLFLEGVTTISKLEETPEANVRIKARVNGGAEQQTTSGAKENILQKDLAVLAEIGSTSLEIDEVLSLSPYLYAQDLNNYLAASRAIETPRRYRITDSFTGAGKTTVVLEEGIEEPMSAVVLSDKQNQEARFTLPLNLPEQGRNMIQLEAVDSLGNTGQRDFAFVFNDNVEPRIELKGKTPRDGDKVGSVDMRIGVIDNYEIENATLLVNGIREGTFNKLSKKEGQLTYQATPQPGNINIEIQAIDSVGNIHRESYSFEYLPGAPTLLTDLPLYTNLTTLEQQLEFDTRVIASATVQPGTVSISNNRLTLNMPNPGAYNLRITAGTGVFNRALIVDRTKPLLKVVSGEKTWTHKPTVKGEWADNIGMKLITVNRVPATLIENNYRQGEYKSTITISNETEVEIIAIDRAGNKATRRYTLTKVDELPFNVTSVEPGIKEGNTWRTKAKKVKIKGTLTDDIDYIFEDLSNGLATITDNNWEVEAYLDSEYGKNIGNRVNVIGVDFGENQIPQTVRIINDRQPPRRPEFQYK